MEGPTVVRSEFDLFSEAPLQRMVKKFQYEEVYSFNNVRTDGSITFQVRGSPNQWIDLDDTYLMVRYKMLTHDGAAIANADTTCIQTIEEPNLFHNLWSKVEMAINNTPIKSVMNPYPMRAYIENLLTTTESGLHEKAESEGFWKERSGSFDAAIQGTVANVRTNTPWRKNIQAKNNGSPEQVMCGKLAVDMWRQGRNIPPTHDLTLILTRSRPQLYLRSSENAGEEHQIQLLDVKLVLKKVQLYDDVQADLDRAMKDAGKIVFPIRRVDVKSYAVGTGTKVFQENNIISGQIPTRVIIGMVDNDAFSGSYAKSPFNFKHYDVEEMYLHFDGEIYPTNMYKTSFPNKDALVPWLNLKRLVTPGHPFFDHTISYEDFLRGGCTLWVFDMSQDNKCGVLADYNNVRQNGDVRLHVRFGAAQGLANPINIVIYSEFENQVEVASNRAVMHNY